MIYSLWILFGLILGVAAIWFTRHFDCERPAFGIALLIAAVWYLSFGIYSGRDLDAMFPQIVGALFFLTCGLLGFRHTLALSVGWLAHMAWDVTSPQFSEVEYMPYWTIPACLGFDTLVGGYLLARHKGMYMIKPKQLSHSDAA